ncbi:aminoglycoside phosphotransferase family protein [Chengkuizengella sp. SCS-71B]|uniref:aminoglycoside phosphotransferase family protein n=1 Tax=Chengkuizengella sp. SCS-71B TaxID=3115290 RepID=UPI0032C24165
MNLKKILENEYNINAKGFNSQTGGWASLAFEVISNNRTYFLKAYEKSRASTPKWTSLIDEYIPIINWFNNNTALNGKIIKPIKTINGNYKCEDDKAIYILFEFIYGTTIGDKNLTEEQIKSLAEIISELHSYGKEIPIATDKIREDFKLPFCLSLKEFFENDITIDSSGIRDSIGPFYPKILELIHVTENLAKILLEMKLKFVLCHTDLHNWNFMQTENNLILIDWEGLKLAPVEADMFFLVDKPYYEKFIDIYKHRHQDFEINEKVLLFYRLRRKLEDIWEWMELIYFDNLDDNEKQNSLHYLMEECHSIQHIPNYSALIIDREGRS